MSYENVQGFLWKVIILALLGCQLSGQPVTGFDTSRQGPGTTSGMPSLVLTGIAVSEEFDYSVSMNAALLLNWIHDKNANQLNVSQTLKYGCLILYEPLLSFSNQFVHNLGCRYFFDSITLVNSDENTIITRFELLIRKKLSATICSNLTTPFLKGYDYSTSDSGTLVALLRSSFLTPLVMTFSSGFGITWKDFGSLTFGITAAKMTHIHNRRIFNIRNVSEYYGVPSGHGTSIEYGLSLQFLVNTELLSRLHWDCDLLLFKNYKSPVDLTFRNLIEFRINKFLKLSNQTRMLYEEKVSRSIQVENIVCIGFYFHL